jgi:hypothetical protein
MFPTYNSLAEVPEAFREHYVMKGGKAVPEVSTDHPLVTNNATLKTEKETAETKAAAAEVRATKAEGDLASATILPRGKRAVDASDAELLDAVKAAGVTKPEDFNTLTTEHGNYKAQAEAAEANAHATSIGEAMKWDKEKTALLVPAVYDLSQVQVRDGKDGAKEVVAKVKQADGSFIEKPFSEVVTATPTLSALVPSLTAGKQPDGTELPAHGAGGGSGKTNVADSYFASVDAAPKPKQAAA